MSILKFWKKAFCFAWMPLYLGGDSESDSSVRTTNNTQNTAFNTDKRVVASDQAVALSGDGSSITKNETSSFTSNTAFSDSSDRSTSFTDSSQRDSNNTTNITTTDFGSVGKALDSVSMMGNAAIGLADDSVGGVIGALKQISSNNLDAVRQAFVTAQGTAADTIQTAQSALAFANQQTATVANATHPDQAKTVLYVALAAIAIVGAAFARKG